MPSAKRFLRGQHRRRQIELARLGAAEQLGQEIGAAVIAGQADLGEGGGDLGGRAGDAEIAGQRDRKPGAGGGAIDLRHHGLRHLVQDARDFHAAAQIGHLGFERQRRPSLRHRFHVAADAERAARALQQHRAHLVILGRAPRRLDQPARHVRIERVAPVGAVHGDGEQALIELLKDHFVCAHVRLLSLLLVVVIPGRCAASNYDVQLHIENLRFRV